MRAIAIIIVALFLVACGGDEFGDIKAELKEKTKDLPRRVPPLPVVKPYEPVPYAALDQQDPFSPGKIQLSVKPAPNDRNSALRPDPNRPKEPLEAYPLESLKMTGMLYQKGAYYGLVKADTGLFEVRTGNYMGQNFGMITKITESQIELRELIQDASGDWSERQTTLQLQEVGGGR